MKRYLVDVNGYRGISPFWDYTHCRETWSVVSSSMFTCFPKKPKKEIVQYYPHHIVFAKQMNCMLILKLKPGIVQRLNLIDKCAGRFHLSVYYQINRKDFKRVILPDEISIKNTSFGEGWHFYKSNDDLSFSVDQKCKSMKLGFQAPFYCGAINYVSVYYYLCPAKTNPLVDFPEVTAPSKKSSPSISVGTCTKNAVKRSGSHHLFMKCYYNGTVEVVGGCECEAGYTKHKNLCKG